MPSPLHEVLALACAWLVLGALGLVRSSSTAWATRALYPAGALVGLLLAGAGLSAIFQPPAALILPLGLPDLPFHVRLDALSAFFLHPARRRRRRHFGLRLRLFPPGRRARAPGLVCLYYHVFLASMALVLLADDAYFFMVAWETMALSSYFLVTSDHRSAEIRSAGYLYLLIAHIGAIAILLCFGVLQGGSGDYTFDAHARARSCRRLWATVAFLLALFGFGAKAGIAAAARLAARGAPGGALAGVGADERRDAEDRDLRPAARDAST